MKRHQIRLVIVSGLSGAGKTVALKSLEDNGYFCIDNLPIPLIEHFFSIVLKKNNIKKIGIGIDIREISFLADFYNIVVELKKHYLVEILFLEAEKGVLEHRFKETRRPHPIIYRQSITNIEEIIEEEREQLLVIRDLSDRIIDTSNYTPHQLKHLISSIYGDLKSTNNLNVSLISFGFKYGVPHNIDILFDVRFLPNPYFVPELKELNGTNKVVANFVLKDQDAQNLLKKICCLLDFVLPLYIKEDKKYLVIGIGCTGGMHRSPVIINELSRYLQKKHKINFEVIHRDIK